MKDLINGELQFGVRCILNRASIPLNEDKKLKQFEHCSACVPVQSRVQQNSLKQNLSIGHRIQVPTTLVPIFSSGQLKFKLQNRPEYLNSSATERDEFNIQETKKLLGRI